MRTRLYIKASTALALALGAVTAAPAAARPILSDPPAAPPAPAQASPLVTWSQYEHATLPGGAYATGIGHRDPYTSPRPVVHAVTPSLPVVQQVTRFGFNNPVRSVGPSAASGFHWGDAGIGAAGGLTLSLIVLGGGLLATQGRSQGAKGQPAVTL